MPAKSLVRSTLLGVLLALQARGHEQECLRGVRVAPAATQPTVPSPSHAAGSVERGIVGPMAALPEELLKEPIHLTCGAVIREMRGGNTINLEVLNRICSEAKSSFEPFLAAQGIAVQQASPFAWNLSFLPSGDCYRCLNDERYRFRHRVVLDRNLIGYTDVAERTIFLTSDAWDAAFRLVFVHELFHAFSIHYRLLADSPGTWQERYVAEEVLAGDFTEWLGYGR